MRYSLHITNNCNLNCTYCYEDNKHNPLHQSFIISFEEIDRRMQDIISKENCHELELLGGEIFLYPDKVKYIFDNYHKYFVFIITTNGTVRNKEIDALIDRYKPYVGVSLDDPCSVIKQRVGINFEQVLNNAKYWRTLTNVGINAVINPCNVFRIKETFDFYVLEHGFNVIHFGCVEEWMNNYYWDVYIKEARRLVLSLPIEILQKVMLSPWKQHNVSKKEYIYEDGIEKVEIFNPRKIDSSPYRQAMYQVYLACCERLGKSPSPFAPDGVEVWTPECLNV